MLNKRFGLIMMFMLLIITTSCRKEFTTIGNQLIDKPDFEGKLYETATVRIYDERIEKVFSSHSHLNLYSNLPAASLGFYNDGKFGNLEADLISDLSYDFKLADDLGDNIKILGAQLVVPYFSTTQTDSQGNNYYELDSIYGNQPFEIKIHELTYLLQSYDPDNDLETLRSYYSDFDFTPYKGAVIGDSLDFEVSNEPYITYKRNKDGTFELNDDDEKIIKDSLGPHMIIKLDTTYFRQKIFDRSGEDVLTGESHFKDYFRGIYIDAISNNGDGTFVLMPFNQGKIIIQYTFDQTDDNDTPNDTSDDTVETIYREIVLNLGSIMVNHYENNLTNYAQTALNNSDMINGDDEIILKGDAGAGAVVQLFDEQDLRDLRLKDWMINQAELYFYVDKTQTEEMLAQAPRLYLYNYDDEKNLLDIFAPENNPDYDYKTYDGKLHTDENGDMYYRFGITRHIRNVLKNDSTNVKLGLRICTNIPKPLKTGDIFRDPDAYNPTGVILYGNQSGVKPPVLKIRYTDPE